MNRSSLSVYIRLGKDQIVSLQKLLDSYVEVWSIEPGKLCHNYVMLATLDVCNDGEVKFSELDVNGNFYVKVCHDGEYYHMCGDKWDSLDAIVACREAGFYQCKTL